MNEILTREFSHILNIIYIQEGRVGCDMYPLKTVLSK